MGMRPYDPREHDVCDPYFPASPWLVAEQYAVSGATRLHESVNTVRNIEHGDRTTLKRLRSKLILLDKYQPSGAKDKKDSLLELIRRGKVAQEALRSQKRIASCPPASNYLPTQTDTTGILRKDRSDKCEESTNR